MAEADSTAESSTAQGAVEGQQTQDSKPAASSTATGPAGSAAPAQGSEAGSPPAKADEPGSHADALKQAMAVMKTAAEARSGQPAAKPEGESPTPQASGKDGDAKPKGEGEGEGQGDRKADGDDEKLSPKAQKRFEALTTKLKEAEPKVRNWDSLQHWVGSAGFNDPQQFARFLEIGRLANLEPHKAIPIVEQTLELLRRRVGETGELPADLKEKLDKGLIDDATAKELAGARARSAYLDKHSEQERQRQAAEETQRRETERVEAISTAVTEAEKAWQARDPDYAKLQPFVADKVLALLQQKGAQIKTPEDARKLFEDAVGEVKRAAATIRGPQREIVPRNGSGGGGGGAVPDPKTHEEALQLAYRSMRAGAHAQP